MFFKCLACASSTVFIPNTLCSLCYDIQTATCWSKAGSIQSIAILPVFQLDLKNNSQFFRRKNIATLNSNENKENVLQSMKVNENNVLLKISVQCILNLHITILFLISMFDIWGFSFIHLSMKPKLTLQRKDGNNNFMF